MATSAEQLFVDALGREPTRDEAQDIRLNLWMLTRAGFAVDDPSNAPLIAPWAWMWARLPRPTDARAALAAVSQEIAERCQTGLQAIQALVGELPKLDHGALAAGIAQRMPPLVVHHRLDGAVFKAALRESLSLLWVWLATVCIGLAGFLGWHYSAVHERAVLASSFAQQTQTLRRQQQIIERLTRRP